LVQTAPGIRLGTPEYIPPEQAFAKGIDETVDLYALGVMFYEMLLGRKPFSAENAQGMYLAHLYEAPKSLLSVAPGIDVPQKVDDLILSLMQKLPENRPQKAKSVLKMINRMIHEAPLIEQTLTEIPALKPFFNSAETDDEDEVFVGTHHSNGRVIVFTVAGIAVGLGLSVLLF
jgi:serine/threonine protein kinase